MPQFRRALPQLHDAIQDAVALNVSVPQSVQSALRNNLLAVNSREPAYWPTVAQYITYRSRAQSNFPVFVSLLASNERQHRCYDTPPGVEAFPPSGPFSYFTCVIDLSDDPDGQVAQLIANLSKNGPDKHFIFSGCVVKYDGKKPINPLLAGAVFQNCFYMFSVGDDIPSQFDQRLIRSVLESGGSTVKVPG